MNHNDNTEWGSQNFPHTNSQKHKAASLLPESYILDVELINQSVFT